MHRLARGHAGADVEADQAADVAARGKPDLESCGRLQAHAAQGGSHAADGHSAPVKGAPGAGAGELQVPSVSIDSLELRDVALIKIDAQGCDLRVLKGAEQTIRQCRPVVTFEFEEKLAALHGDTLPAFEAFIAELDYELTPLVHSSSTQQDFCARPRELA